MLSGFWSIISFSTCTIIYLKHSYNCCVLFDLLNIPKYSFVKKILFSASDKIRCRKGHSKQCVPLFSLYIFKIYIKKCWALKSMSLQFSLFCHFIIYIYINTTHTNLFMFTPLSSLHLKAHIRAIICARNYVTIIFRFEVFEVFK